ncbi:hypothetical protein DS885_03840 [Psychromonas sp. B3M02]|uniref:hypothetical protein n=1 Tax=Psychromonas sp. B3M02 TaxID=2267226 RepID=UPI000DE9F1CC|nr:hypothetical protein [Psychromonas sp. B3M02]RBW47288.1 hypothetical protein DS885_03840 [Psychromonas sp. B3M02]
MLNPEELALLNELKEKIKLTPQEKAQIKALERKNKKTNRNAAEDRGVQRNNVFSTESTTKVNPIPIRFLAIERNGLTNRGNAIKDNSLDDIFDILGPNGKRDINETKLIRAAVYLLKERSDIEILKAIKAVQLQMYKGKS